MVQEFGVNVLSAQNFLDCLGLNCHECLVHEGLMVNNPKRCPATTTNRLSHFLILVWLLSSNSNCHVSTDFMPPLSRSF